MLPENKNKIDLPTIRAPQWECPICPLKSSNVRYLKQHLKNKHCYLCPNCAHCFVTFQHQKEHETQCKAMSFGKLLQSTQSTRLPPKCVKCSTVQCNSWKDYFCHLFDIHQSDIRFSADTGRIFPLADSDDRDVLEVKRIKMSDSSSTLSNRDTVPVLTVEMKQKIDEELHSNDDSSAPKRLVIDEPIENFSVKPVENIVDMDAESTETVSIQSIGENVESDNGSQPSISPVTFPCVEIGEKGSKDIENNVAENIPAVAFGSNRICEDEILTDIEVKLPLFFIKQLLWSDQTTGADTLSANTVRDFHIQCRLL